MILLQTVCALLLGASFVVTDIEICQEKDTSNCTVIRCGSPGKDALPGINGKDGENGKQGPPGQKGENGATGDTGARGMPGLPGTKGDLGPKGQKGDPGLTGPRGQTGQKGDKGDSADSAIAVLKRQVASLEGQLSSLQSNMAAQKKALLFSRGVTGGAKLFVTNGKEESYNEAKSSCSKAGGQMAAPRNAEENQALLTIALQYDKNLWLGINDIQTEGSFRYLDGASISYSNWNTGEPNNTNRGEDCVMMLNTGKWNDGECDIEFITICEFS